MKVEILSKEKEEIIVYYGGGKIKPDVDEALREVLSALGWESVGSGMDLINGERDLQFKKNK